MAAIPERLVLATSSEDGLKDQLENIFQSRSCQNHPFIVELAANPQLYARTTFADVLHHLGLLYGTRPNFFDIIEVYTPVELRDWLTLARDSFAYERSLVTKLVVAAGPPPARIGQTRVSTAVDSARHALLTLAGSERLGCALGAAGALVLDWAAVGHLLRQIAATLDIEAIQPAYTKPSVTDCYNMLEIAATLPAGERAVLFGFQALLSQHRAFWDIVASRSQLAAV